MKKTSDPWYLMGIQNCVFTAAVCLISSSSVTEEKCIEHKTCFSFSSATFVQNSFHLHTWTKDVGFHVKRLLKLPSLNENWHGSISYKILQCQEFMAQFLIKFSSVRIHEKPASSSDVFQGQKNWGKGHGLTCKRCVGD